MKEKNNIKEIEDLFREKLEGAEIEPGEGVFAAISAKVNFRDYFRFNPGRLNIWYTMAAVTMAVASTLLFNGPRTKEEITPLQTIVIDSSLFSDKNVMTSDTSLSETGNSEIKHRRPTDRELKVTTDNVRPNMTGEMTIFDVEGPAAAAETLQARSYTGPGNNIVTSTKGTSITVARITASQLSGCAPLSVNFINSSLNWNSCVWSFGDGGESSVENPAWLFDEAGNYSVSLKVFDKQGKEYQTQVSIVVFAKPVARFEVADNRQALPGEGVKFINLSSGAVRYRWSYGDGGKSDQFEPVYRYQKSGVYSITLHAMSADGCQDSLTISELFKGTSYYIEFPNALIANPGGPTGGYYSAVTDQAATVFHPVTVGVADYNLRIFSKRGILLFETSDIAVGWDGYYKGQLCEPGVYIWKARGKYRNGEPFVKMGDLTLFKQ